MGTTVPRILLVDDERNFRLILARALRTRGYTVVEAAAGAAILDLVEREPPLLLLLDVHLPDMTGWEVLRRLAAAGCATVPTIVFSAAPPEPDLMERYGVAFLAKPFALDTFLRLVADTLDRGVHTEVVRSEESWRPAATETGGSGPQHRGAPVTRQGVA